MTVKLVVLKSGEDVVADIQEMLVKDPEGNDKTVGYFFKYPCRVKLLGNEVKKDGNISTPFKMQLTPWMPLAKEQIIPVVVDWVVTVIEPIDQLKEMYEDGIEKYVQGESEASSTDQQFNIVESD